MHQMAWNWKNFRKGKAECSFMQTTTDVHVKRRVFEGHLCFMEAVSSLLCESEMIFPLVVADLKKKKKGVFVWDIRISRLSSEQHAPLALFSPEVISLARSSRLFTPHFLPPISILFAEKKRDNWRRFWVLVYFGVHSLNKIICTLRTSFPYECHQWKLLREFQHSLIEDNFCNSFFIFFINEI